MELCCYFELKSESMSFSFVHLLSLCSTWGNEESASPSRHPANPDLAEFRSRRFICLHLEQVEERAVIVMMKGVAKRF
jgi:hypothetical protein